MMSDALVEQAGFSWGVLYLLVGAFCFILLTDSSKAKRILIRSCVSSEALPLIFADVVSIIRCKIYHVKADRGERHSTDSTKARSA